MKTRYEIFTEKLYDCAELLLSCHKGMFDFDEPQFLEVDFETLIHILFGMLEREAARNAQELIKSKNNLIYLGDIDQKLMKDLEPIQNQINMLVKNVLGGNYMEGVVSTDTNK